MGLVFFRVMRILSDLNATPEAAYHLKQNRMLLFTYLLGRSIASLVFRKNSFHFRLFV